MTIRDCCINKRKLLPRRAMGVSIVKRLLDRQIQNELTSWDGLFWVLRGVGSQAEPVVESRSDN